MMRGEQGKHWLPASSNMGDVLVCFAKGGVELVVILSDEFRVVGTISNGDLRRALVKNPPKTLPVTEFMNTSPIVMADNVSQDEMTRVSVQNSVRQIPLEDENGCFSGIFGFDGLPVPDRIDMPVLIMAGGFGKRLMPLTQDTPKPMLKLHGRPILEHIIDGLVREGFSNFFIATHYLGKMIRDYFGDGSQKSITITYLDEDEPLGTGGALSLLPYMEQPVLVLNGDVITSTSYRNIAAFHANQEADMTVASRIYEAQVPFGVIVSQNEMVTELIEKPIQQYIVNAGIYVVNAKVINELGEVRKFHITDLIEQLLRSGRAVANYQILEFWQDVGQHDDFNMVQDMKQWPGPVREHPKK